MSVIFHSLCGWCCSNWHCPILPTPPAITLLCNYFDTLDCTSFASSRHGHVSVHISPAAEKWWPVLCFKKTNCFSRFFFMQWTKLTAAMGTQSPMHVEPYPCQQRCLGHLISFTDWRSPRFRWTGTHTIQLSKSTNLKESIHTKLQEYWGHSASRWMGQWYCRGAFMANFNFWMKTK